MLPVEREVIQFFINLCQALSLPKSLAEIFGYLFCSPKPLCFDDIVTGTSISKGSVSQGIRFLQKINAVHTVYVEQDRRTFYAPELGMKRLIDGFLRETVEPHLRSGSDQLDRISMLLKESEKSDSLSPKEQHIKDRLKNLHSWNSKATSLLPWITRFTGGSKGKKE